MPKRDPDLSMQVDVWMDEDKTYIKQVNIETNPVFCVALQYYLLCAVADIMEESDAIVMGHGGDAVFSRN